MRSDEVSIHIRDAALPGTLTIPGGARGLVVFAHGSGSSRLSPRNRRVARALEARGLATLLFDLLTADEERRDAIDARLRFDIPRLAERLIATVDWAAREARTRALPIGCFGASTGAAAALIAAAERPKEVRAVVSRGGRPDLAGSALARVRAPTLLLVGGADEAVLALNERARAQMEASCTLSIIEGATHLFEEPGALEEVARQAGAFFLRHLATRREGDGAARR